MERYTLTGTNVCAVAYEVRSTVRKGVLSPISLAPEEEEKDEGCLAVLGQVKTNGAGRAPASKKSATTSLCHQQRG
jgi:hypothetical protein